MIRTTGDKLFDFMQECRKSKIPFLSISSGMSNSLSSEGLDYVANNTNFPPNELYFIGYVKKKILEQGLSKRKIMSGVDPSKIRYFKYSNLLIPGTIITDCVEIDLNSAYWESAYKLGILPEDVYNRALYGMTWKEARQKRVIGKKLYEECKNLSMKDAIRMGLINEKICRRMSPISKVIRLAAIGSLAKETRVTYYSGFKYHTLLRKKDENSFMWDAICNNIYELIKSAIRHVGLNNFIFFWVDAIVVKKETANKLIEFFENHKYPCKTFVIDRIEIGDTKMRVFSNKESKNGSPVREFNLSNRKKKKK